jgi:hypothetical protein
VETVAGDTLRYRCPDAHQLNPALVARLSALGIALVRLAEVPRRLEDVYLQIIAGEDVDRGEWTQAGGISGEGLALPVPLPAIKD